MTEPSLSDLKVFVAVATHRSFRKAADEMGVSPSTLSHTMRSLETDLGVRLLNRTTRSVAVTEAGERLLARLSPVLIDLASALDEVDPYRSTPAGTVRINAAAGVVGLLVRHVVPEVLKRHPQVSVDIVSEGRLVDIVEGGFDAGVRLGETVPRDMVAIRFGPEARFICVASPDYLARASTPATPEDLAAHDCIRHRMPSGKLYRWEFERHGQELAVDVPGRLTLDDQALMTDAAIAGLGIAYVSEQSAREALADGRLTPVLLDWCPPFPGLYLYYPGHRRVPPALRAFIDVLKEIKLPTSDL
ncbi:LysR family transcriptional regulator [Ciceribacter sp. L1K23]|uniref:LysR family transcriptional regulator n=1 Tax=Ciceribacter sp. L1K23 TaxID=2820276 RepID=UPI001B81B20E|nr:LysR family transcriptional regulator [Ciceribacter sp. L1K23]MBR0554657.1 LysR family transcriptional regulator [Ciceribacter sp. L1K23]